MAKAAVLHDHPRSPKPREGSAREEAAESPKQEAAEVAAGAAPDDVPGRHRREHAAMLKAHIRERKDMDGNHRAEIQKMSGRHDKQVVEMQQRHQQEMAAMQATAPNVQAASNVAQSAPMPQPQAAM
jgi:hypothetical protein